MDAFAAVYLSRSFGFSGSVVFVLAMASLTLVVVGILKLIGRK